MDDITPSSTLGDLATHLTAWRDAGMTLPCVMYALERVYYEDLDKMATFGPFYAESQR